MKLVFLCLLSWPWAPGAALPRHLGRSWCFLTEPQVNELPSPEWSGAEGGTQPSPLPPGDALKAKASPDSRRKESPRTAVQDRRVGWDFSLLLIFISALLLLVASQCCFYQIVGNHLLSCVRRGWRGGLRHWRRLSRITLVNSLRRYGGVLVSRASRGLAAESQGRRLAPSVLYSKPFVHFRQVISGVAKDGSVPLPLPSPGSGTAPVTILEMEEEL